MDTNLRELQRKAAVGTLGDRMAYHRALVKADGPKWDSNLIEEIVKDLGVQYETHDSHGFYIEFWVGKVWYMLDPTPETQYKDGLCVKTYPDGMIMVRDSSHHYSKPTQLAEFDNDLDGLRVYLQGLVL